MRRIATTAVLPAALTALLLALLTGCSPYKTTGGDGRMPELEADAQTAIARFKEQDPSIEQFFENSYGYAVFPKVAKGGAGIGGARGRGVVYRDGQMVGYATLSQGSVGFQLGGQVYRELIFFKDEHAFREFTEGNLEFSGQASAVAASAGASANADYEAGVAIFTLQRGGLMYEASIGGQKFSFTPLPDNAGDTSAGTGGEG